MILNLGNADSNQNTLPDEITGTNIEQLDLHYNVMKLINVYKNTLNMACSNLSRIDVNMNDVVLYSNFKKTIKEIFDPEV